MFKLITTLDEMKSLETEWNTLGLNFSSPMLQFDWFFNCAKYLHPSSALRIFLIYSDDNLVAVAPLVQVKYKFSHWLEIIGTSKTYEPSGLIYKNHASLLLLLRSILKYGLPLNLQRIPDNSSELAACIAIKKPLRLLIHRQSASSYYLNPENNWTEFLLKSGKKWSADFRNKANRAKRLGNIQIDHLRPDNNTIKQYFNEAMIVESRSWKGKQASALINNSNLRNFFESYFSSRIEKKCLLFTFYRLDKQAVAMHISEQNNNTLWSYKIGYDASFSRISPGMQLILGVLKDAFSHGQSYEFLGSSESWQKAWPVKEHKYQSIILYPFSFNGVIAFIDTATDVLYRKISSATQSFMKKNNKI